MTKSEKEKYHDAPTIGTYCISNWGGIAVKGIEYGIEDYIIVEWFGKSIYRRRIDYTLNGRAYFRLGNVRYHLDEFMR